jgi:succinate-semialdehyde dehydrogenase/glutarate-semialdehyde dehydrogenase
MPTISTVNPATGKPLGYYKAHGWEEIDARLSRARTAAGAWGRTPVSHRAELLRAVGTLLALRRAEYAELITAEMGKPLTESLAEIDKCAWDCEVVAAQAAGWLADRPVDTAPQRSWVSYEPLGVVLAVMPWNYPFWQVVRFAAAALAAGDAAVVKHAPNVTGCALAIERMFADAGAAAGLYTALLLAEDDVPSLVPGIIADPRVAAVTLTGSERAGIAVGTAAGAALKKSVLELGGSDPFVVLADADLPAAADAAVKSRFGNAGQSCISAKRFIVHSGVADEFVALLAARVATLDIGPIARADLRDGLDRQVTASVEEGAVVVAGGSPVPGPGFYYQPTVLDHVTPGMTAFDEETFGPVAAVVRARDDEHCVELANLGDFGLGAAVWGAPERALRLGRRLRSGSLFVNAMVASDPRLPFGGVGRSGYGRELSAEGTREFTNIRTVVVAP